MSDLFLLDGDLAVFYPSFANAVVTIKPGVLRGSGPDTLDGKKYCVEGDEKQVAVAGCSYVTPQFSIPGTGTLKIAALDYTAISREAKSGGKAVLLNGGKFVAKFEVQIPAMQPPTGLGWPMPDPTPQYHGNGSFVTCHDMNH